MCSKPRSSIRADASNSSRDAIYGHDHVDPVRTPLVTHRIQVQPLPTEGEPLPTAFPIVIVDCDGTAANALLKHPDNPLAGLGIRGGSLAKAVIEADVLILALSAEDNEEEQSRSFEDFLLFLERLHGRKTFAREVGGFPIVLALTQSDRLALPGDTTERWERHVAARLDELVSRLSDYLLDGSQAPGVQSPYLPFGSVVVKGYAVAIHRPRLSDDPTPLDEPFGVAELFRDCFDAAQNQRKKAATSDRRLSWTVPRRPLGTRGDDAGHVPDSRLPATRREHARRPHPRLSAADRTRTRSPARDEKHHADRTAASELPHQSRLRRSPRRLAALRRESTR